MRKSSVDGEDDDDVMGGDRECHGYFYGCGFLDIIRFQGLKLINKKVSTFY